MRTDMRATLADEKEDSVSTLQHQLHTCKQFIGHAVICDTSISTAAL
jgi:hypothetical protein